MVNPRPGASATLGGDKRCQRPISSSPASVPAIKPHSVTKFGTGSKRTRDLGLIGKHGIWGSSGNTNVSSSLNSPAGRITKAQVLIELEFTLGQKERALQTSPYNETVRNHVSILHHASYILISFPSRAHMSILQLCKLVETGVSQEELQQVLTQLRTLLRLAAPPPPPPPPQLLSDRGLHVRHILGQLQSRLCLPRPALNLPAMFGHTAFHHSGTSRQNPQTIGLPMQGKGHDDALNSKAAAAAELAKGEAELRAHQDHFMSNLSGDAQVGVPQDDDDWVWKNAMKDGRISTGVSCNLSRRGARFYKQPGFQATQ
ncbi:hypothetical protein HGRIS_001580 [Hohenbuehelia grisea]|uniref:Uncharacterized protein n=1 Tax=Hohenbuehelia grisea TaxID=104357 RepID=A0ABR3JR96_9AGAR